MNDGGDNNRILMGKILAEVYRVQRKLEMPCNTGDPQIYGLLHGFEHVIDDELQRIGFVSKAQFDHVVSVLTPYWEDNTKLDTFKGFYDIEGKLQEYGVDRGTASVILTYLLANGQFQEVISKMNSQGSPTECKTFEIDRLEK